VVDKMISEIELDTLMLFKDISLREDYITGKILVEEFIILYNLNQRYKNPKYHSKIMVLDPQNISLC
jgi:hypothetical protein